MVLFEQYARLLLVLHTVAAVALTAVTTHIVVWMRGYPRGKFGRHKGVRKLAWISASLFVLTFLLGNALYPTYKTRVRMQYLESPEAVVGDQEQRRQAKVRLLDSENRRRALTGTEAIPVTSRTPVSPTNHSPRDTAKIARWFDVKEHWVALGMAMSVGLLLIVLVWDPRKQGAQIASLVFALALGTAATTWLAAIVGILVSSYRAVGQL